jgi:hypothetical protein
MKPHQGQESIMLLLFAKTADYLRLFESRVPQTFCAFRLRQAWS